MLLYWCTGFLMDLSALPRPGTPLALECGVAREVGGTASTWGADSYTGAGADGATLTWRMKSPERDWLVFQLSVTKVAAIATGNTWMFSTWGRV